MGTFSLKYTTGGKEIRLKNETNYKALCSRHPDPKEAILVKVVMKNADEKPAAVDNEERKTVDDAVISFTTEI